MLEIIGERERSEYSRKRFLFKCLKFILRIFKSFLNVNLQRVPGVSSAYGLSNGTEIDQRQDISEGITIVAKFTPCSDDQGVIHSYWNGMQLRRPCKKRELRSKAMDLSIRIISGRLRWLTPAGRRAPPRPISSNIHRIPLGMKCSLWAEL